VNKYLFSFFLLFNFSVIFSSLFSHLPYKLYPTPEPKNTQPKLEPSIFQPTPNSPLKRDPSFLFLPEIKSKRNSLPSYFSPHEGKMYNVKRRFVKDIILTPPKGQTTLEIEEKYQLDNNHYTTDLD